MNVNFRQEYHKLVTKCITCYLFIHILQASTLFLAYQNLWLAKEPKYTSCLFHFQNFQSFYCYTVFYHQLIFFCFTNFC